MREPMTEPFEAYEPYQAYEPTADDSDYDWDYDEEPQREGEPMNILWGRVAILGVALLLAFLFGRATKDGGVSPSELTSAERRVQSLQTENEDLRAQLAAQPEVTDPVDTAPAEEETTTEAPADEAESTEIVGQTYTVERGDTLRGIAQEFYGDPELSDYLAEVNNITDPTAISVGMKLIIPDDPPE